MQSGDTESPSDVSNQIRRFRSISPSRVCPRDRHSTAILRPPLGPHCFCRVTQRVSWHRVIAKRDENKKRPGNCQAFFLIGLSPLQPLHIRAFPGRGGTDAIEPVSTLIDDARFDGAVHLARTRHVLSDARRTSARTRPAVLR